MGAGASLHGSVFQVWLRDYMRIARGTCIDYSAVGRTGGFELVSSGRTDFAVYASSPPGVDKRFRTRWRSVHVGAAAVAPIYHLDGIPRLRLSKGTLAGIFSGQVTRWDDALIRRDNPGVELPSIEILLYHDLPSGARRGGQAASVFMGYLDGAMKDRGDAAVERGLAGSRSYKGAEAEVGFVRANPGALSYAWLLPSPEGFRYAAVENDFGEFVEPTPDSVSEATKKYWVPAGVADDLVFEQGPGAYPIVVSLAIRYARDGERRSDVEAFIRWVLTEGQAIAHRNGQPSISPELVRRELQRMKTQGGEAGP